MLELMIPDPIVACQTCTGPGAHRLAKRTIFTRAPVDNAAACSTSATAAGQAAAAAASAAGFFPAEIEACRLALATATDEPARWAAHQALKAAVQRIRQQLTSEQERAAAELNTLSLGGVGGGGGGDDGARARAEAVLEFHTQALSGLKRLLRPLRFGEFEALAAVNVKINTTTQPVLGNPISTTPPNQARRDTLASLSIAVIRDPASRIMSAYVMAPVLL